MKAGGKSIDELTGELLHVSYCKGNYWAADQFKNRPLGLSAI